MDRRAFLTLAAVAGAAQGASAHTPFRQWVVYRQKHLLIGAHRGDAATYRLAKAVVTSLSDALPDASARVARGPRPERLASLLGTGQLMIAVLSYDEARAMRSATAPFDGYEPIPLSLLAELEPGYGLVSHSDFSHDHAWLVVEALARTSLARAPQDHRIELHPAAAEIWSGAPPASDLPPHR